MRKPGTVVALVASLLLLAGGSLMAESSTRPPTDLKKVGDHWTPWDPPEPGPEDYLIEKGDTLWDLAERWFGDPYLWPQIWDENRYILDSHWIYPGDPLVVPGRPTVVPDEGPPTPIDLSERTGEEGSGAGQGRLPRELAEVEMVAPAPLLPVADPTDLYCTGFIDSSSGEYDVKIAAHETERFTLGQGNVVFLNSGWDRGLRAGDELAIVRRDRKVKHPANDLSIGTLVRRMGKARVMIARETTSTAIIELSCEDIYDGDQLIPWEDIPSPMMSSMPEFDPLTVVPSGGPAGHIVFLRDNIEVAGAGHVIFTDLGESAGVAPGDILTFYRSRDNLTWGSKRKHKLSDDYPRLELGQAVVLTTELDSSTAKITASVQELAVGDRVERLR